MKRPEDIKTVTVDEVEYNYDDLSPEIQQLIDIFNEWNKKEVDARLDLLQIQSAKRDISRTIVEAIKKSTEVESDSAPDDTSDSRPN